MALGDYVVFPDLSPYEALIPSSPFKKMAKMAE